MVDHYAKLADHVKVYISAPKSKKSQRFCGTVCLNPHMSLSLWKLLLGNRSNVSVEVSESPSPIKVAYDSVLPGHPWAPGTTVYLGASDKGNDAMRFAGAVNQADTNINVPDPLANAAPAAQLPDIYIAKLEQQSFYNDMPSIKKGKDPKDYSASDLRFLLDRAQTDISARDLAGYFVGAENLSAYMAAIGLIKENKKYNLKYMLFEN